MPEIKINQRRVFYEQQGHGPAIVLLQPQSTGPAGIAPFKDGLAASHTVYSYHQRGTGQSDAVPGDLTMHALARDALDLMDALSVESAHLICHSTGCGIGIATTQMAPGRVNSLSLIAPWTWGDPHLTTMQTMRIAAARALDPEQYQRFNASILFPVTFRREHQDGFTALAQAAAHSPVDADDFARRLKAILEFDARLALKDIACPTFVAGSRDDQLMPLWFAEEAAALVDGARLVDIPDAGHMIPETRPEPLLAELAAFLAAATG